MVQIVNAQKLVQNWDEKNQQRIFEATDELQQCAVDLSLQLASASSGLQKLSDLVDSSEWSFSSAIELAEKPTESATAAEVLGDWYVKIRFVYACHEIGH